MAPFEGSLSSLRCRVGDMVERQEVELALVDQQQVVDALGDAPDPRALAAGQDQRTDDAAEGQRGAHAGRGGMGVNEREGENELIEADQSTEPDKEPRFTGAWVLGVAP